jgi:outer membrane protein OmpA-like peptidoglycan-associated protein
MRSVGVLVAVGSVLLAGPALSAAGATQAGPSNPSPARSTVTDRVLDVAYRSVRSGIRETQGVDTDLALDTDVLFAFGKATLTGAAAQTLAQAAKQLTGHAKGTVMVNGYTDAVGSDVVNLTLSRVRAAAVQRALVPLLAKTGLRLQASGHGEGDPVAPNAFPSGKDNPEGRKLNRRVSLVYRS